MHVRTSAVGLGLAALGLLVTGCTMPQPPTTVRSTPWALAAEPEGATLQLTVAIGSSSCDRFERIDVAEGPGIVTIETFVRTSAGPGVACTTDFGVQDMTVTLDAPLADRALTGCDPDPTIDCREVRSLL